MDQYLLDEYKKRKNNRENMAEKAKRNRAIKLFEEGLRDIGVIAEALETTEKTIISYLGKTRIDICQGIIEETPEEVQVTKKDGKREGASKPKNNVQKPKRFTERDAENYSKDRDLRIKMYHNDGLSVEEIANKLRMTENQVKERLIAMGLLYNSSEIREMRERARKKENTSIVQKSKNEREEHMPEQTEKPSTTSENNENKATQRDGEGEFRSFDELIEAIHRLIKDRRSKNAMILAREYSRHADFLSDEEREKLTKMANTIELLRARESGRKLMGR